MSTFDQTTLGGGKKISEDYKNLKTLIYDFSHLELN